MAIYKPERKKRNPSSVIAIDAVVSIIRSMNHANFFLFPVNLVAIFLVNPKTTTPVIVDAIPKAIMNDGPIPRPVNPTPVL